MNDKQFNTLLHILDRANKHYKDLLGLAEKEFFRRYGNYPSDIDFDSWIDIYHVGTGFISAEEIDQEMKDPINREKSSIPD